MMKLFSTVYKELLLLFRDRAGLLVLFLMPAALVIIVSLVQENVLKTTGEIDVQVVLADLDRGAVGDAIRKGLAEAGAMEIVEAGRGPDGGPGAGLDRDGKADDAAVEKAVAHGDAQVGIIIPAGLTRNMQARIDAQIEAAFAGKPASEAENVSLPELRLYFDPLAQGSFRSAIVNAIHRIILMMEMEMKAGAFTGAVRSFVPEMSDDWGSGRLLDLRVERTGRGGVEKLPTSVQQNVPAWALFGMFFIVVPLSGALIREREDGTQTRLLTLPVSYGILLMGKVIAYVFICLVQFGIILLIGIYVLPLMGTPVLEIGSSPEAVAVIVLSAALAASGYGIALGVFSGTYEQASMFGPVSIVIAAALGGIMVPVYVMPETMREISRFSPLAWGLNGLTELFVREGDLISVLPEIAYLLLFAAGMLGAAWIGFSRRRRF